MEINGILIEQELGHTKFFVTFCLWHGDVKVPREKWQKKIQS